MADPYLPPGERRALEQELVGCEREAEDAREGDQEKDREKLLLCLERGLHLQRRLHAESSQQVTSACQQLCEACNFMATRLLQSDNFKAALQFLKRAEEVADKSELDRAVTWNNLAVYYRRVGKLRTAVTFLERALAIEEHLGNADAAQTHLNLCATLSQLDRHEDAIRHVQSALIRMYEVLSPLMLNGELDPSDGEGPAEAHREQVSVLCIAYHNLAVEHEYMKSLDAALCAYSSGLRWAKRFLDPSHQLVGILKDSADAVRAKLPLNSVALRRASDLAAGFPPRGGAAGSGSSDFSQLMTPRKGPDDGLAGVPEGEHSTSDDESGN